MKAQKRGRFFSRSVTSSIFFAFFMHFIRGRERLRFEIRADKFRVSGSLLGRAPAAGGLVFHHFFFLSSGRIGDGWSKARNRFRIRIELAKTPESRLARTYSVTATHPSVSTPSLPCTYTNGTRFFLLQTSPKSRSSLEFKVRMQSLAAGDSAMRKRNH